MTRLTVHKNTRTQRRAKELRQDLHKAARELDKLPRLSGYAMVAWNEDCTTDCYWVSTPPMMPSLVAPEFTKRILERELANLDAKAINAGAE